MKKIIFLVLCLSVLNQTFSQNSKILGQYHLIKTNYTPEDWVSLTGSATVTKNNDGSVNITGDYLIRTTETTSLKANFNAENCAIPSNNSFRTFPATGDIYVTHSNGSGSERHFNVTSIKVNFEKQEISIYNTDPSDGRLTGREMWAKGTAPSTTPSKQSRPTQQPTSTTQTFIGCALQGTITDEGTLYSSSDNSEIDRATKEELRFLKSSFLVNPVFFYYDDSEGENAFSTPEQLAGSSSDDGTIAFGLGLIKKQISLSVNGTNVPVILAHEFAHTVARKYELNLPTKQNELFADYLAGGYMFYRNLNFKRTDLNAAFRSFYNMGDNDFTNPDHHGTPASRYACIKQGYNDCYNAYKQHKAFTLDEGVELAKEFVTTHDLP